MPISASVNMADITDDLVNEPPTDINPYESLELSTSATSNEVKTAYKKLALRHHPGIQTFLDSKAQDLSSPNRQSSPIRARLCAY